MAPILIGSFPAGAALAGALAWAITIETEIILKKRTKTVKIASFFIFLLLLKKKLHERFPFKPFLQASNIMDRKRCQLKIKRAQRNCCSLYRLDRFQKDCTDSHDFLRFSHPCNQRVLKKSEPSLTVDLRVSLNLLDEILHGFFKKILGLPAPVFRGFCLFEIFRPAPN